MCGIVAIYTTGDNQLEPATIESMTNSLTHRGPDDYGYAFISAAQVKTWREEAPPTIDSAGVVMGHRRLSIIDLSVVGRQPFASANERYWIVYNGEIYNYLELRQELTNLGFTFRSQTDTEVLLAAYEVWGAECFNKLNGMWAFVIWDRQQKELIACRDRFGIKPLYYCELNGDWLFASEAKALLMHPEINFEPNRQAVFDYLLDNIAPSEGHTFFKSIKAVEPGTYLRLSNNRVKKCTFWTLPCDEGQFINNFDDAVDRFQTLFTSSVQLRLRSDVRVGTTLSGGLDSTSVIRTIADLLGFDESAQQAIGASIQGFNASYPGDAIDETKKVEELCQSLTISLHKVFPMEVDDVAGLLGDVIYHNEMPFHSSIPMVNTLLMRRARAEGVKVLLNGHGADEMLAGYPAMHCSVATADEFRRLRWGRAIEEIRGMTVNQGHSWKSSLKLSLAHIRPLSYLLRKRDTEARRLRTHFGQDVLKEYASTREKRNKYILPGRTGLDRLLKTQFFRDILPRWLHMEDRMSMSASVESRLPFLDYRVVEFAFNIDSSFKVRSGVTKHILREAMQGKLPESIVRDTEKRIFPGPDRFFLTGPLRSLLLSTLTETTPLISEFIGKGATTAIIHDYLEGNPRTNNLVWRLLQTELWMRQFVNY